MLERFLPAVCDTLLSPQVRKCGHADDICSLKETDITHAEEIVMTLKPIKGATNIMSEDSTPTLSVITPSHAQLLLDTQADFRDTAVVREVKKKKTYKGKKLHK